VFGLMDAIRGFDPDRGIKFKTYCTTRIRGSILDQLRSQDWVPRLVRLKAGRIEKALQKLQGEYGREPTHAELANGAAHGPRASSREIDESRTPRRSSRSPSAGTSATTTPRWRRSRWSRTQARSDPIKEMNKPRLMLKYITRSLTHKEQFIIEQYYHDRSHDAGDRRDAGAHRERACARSTRT
jgi:RNA polymerase sigma factor for flagellar operon FliA